MRLQPNRIKPAASRLRVPDTAGGFAKKHYRTTAHQEWAKAVKRRDKYTCQSCGVRIGDINPRTGKSVWLIADHIVELRDGGSATDLSNGICRCSACHQAKTKAVAAERSRRR